jgi:hypothetical protein
MKAVVTVWPPDREGRFCWAARLVAGEPSRPRTLAIVRPPGRSYKSMRGAVNAAARILRQVDPTMTIDLDLR